MILVAPDSFKGTFSAAEVAVAIGRGIERAGHSADLCPAADGGEGTIAALGEALALEPVAAEVSDALGRPIDAGFGFSPGRGARSPRSRPAAVSAGPS